jgi:hypothetical protein
MIAKTRYRKGLKLARRPDGWWIVPLASGPRWFDCGDMGPYDTRREADDDRRGVERFYQRLAKAAARDAKRHVTKRLTTTAPRG